MRLFYSAVSKINIEINIARRSAGLAVHGNEKDIFIVSDCI